MPTNEAGLSGGQDQGAGGPTTASDMPGGEKNTGVNPSRKGAGPDQDFADGGHLGRAGDPVEGTTRDSATGEDAESGS